MDGKIYSAINAVMNDVGAIGKEKKNQTQGFMYRGIDDVMNALQPAFIAHKIFVVPEILEQTREERASKNGATLIYSVCRVRYTFFADDGSSVSAVVVGEGMDSGDKATNKAMSIAFKYACFQVFCIPTEEMKDPDEESHEVKPKYILSHSREVASLIEGTDVSPASVASMLKEKYGKEKANDLTDEEFYEFIKLLKGMITS